MQAGRCSDALATRRQTASRREGSAPVARRTPVRSGSFPYVLGLVLLLTLVLLTRAFRSIVLAVKAVVLNLFSLAAAYGIVVLVFQQGHGSSLWNITASGSVTAWIPLMIFAFLFGL
ncbi:MAG: putative drug exporter of the superfamily, partial [Frankiaceae bacterium]|nr:putative drug exporter of the superfamily [Frankiaceae bacterium]